MSTARRLLLLATAALGILSLLASSLTEEEAPQPSVPVEVSFSLITTSTGLSREHDIHTATLSGQLIGAYQSTQGQVLSLDRAFVDVDVATSFTLTLTPPGAGDALSGEATVQLSAPLDLGIAHSPLAGEFTSVFEGTMTVVTANGSGVDVLVGAASSADRFGWGAFEDLERDENAADDLRVASAAYNMMVVTLRAALLGEDIIDDVEANRQALEDMALNSVLDLSGDCDNTADQGSGEARLLWTSDANGSGQGLIGAGDAFEARYRNCRNAGLDRFLENFAALRDYQPTADQGLRTFGLEIELSNLFVSTVEVDLDTTAAAESPQYNGGIALLYIETEISAAP